MVQISPSILTADFCKLGEAVKELEKAKADMLHFDVMDGIFVPNISIGIPVCKSVFENTTLPLDVHLMIQKPQLYIKQFAKYSQRITIHYESDCDVESTLKMIRDEGVIAGLTIKPNTPAEVVFPYLDKVGMILVMSVEPGFGGQSYIESATDKIRIIREEIDKRGLDVEIQVDGGINFETAPIAAGAGADILVAGSAVFNADDMGEAINKLKEICK